MYKKEHTTRTTKLTPLVYNTMTLFMFVDNMELIQMDPKRDTHLDMIVDHPQEGNRARKETIIFTGGELNKEKCFWYIVY